MKVRISQMFHDKADYTKVYLVGETHSFDDERAAYLIGLGLAESVEECEKPSETVFTQPIEVKIARQPRKRTSKDNQ